MKVLNNPGLVTFSTQLPIMTWVRKVAPHKLGMTQYIFNTEWRQIWALRHILAIERSGLLHP